MLDAARGNLSFRLGVILVAVQVLIALAAPLLSPYDPDRQHDPGSASSRPPGTRMWAVEQAGGRWLLADRIERTPEGLRAERRGVWREIPADRIENLNPDGLVDRRLFLLGTDRYGRDLLSRLLYGARVSLAVAFLSMAMSVTLGVAVGGLAATAGTWVDGLLMRLADAFLAFPPLFLLITVSALLRPSNALLILILGGTGWMTVSRMARAEILGLQQHEYILAARAMGLGPMRILLRHLLPNSLAPILVAAALMVGNVILAESALSFLGLGIQPPEASWGTILSDGSDSLARTWWMSVFSGLAIAITVAGLNLLADGLRDHLDPRLKGHGDG